MLLLAPYIRVPGRRVGVLTVAYNLRHRVAFQAVLYATYVIYAASLICDIAIWFTFNPAARLWSNRLSFYIGACLVLSVMLLFMLYGRNMRCCVAPTVG